MDSLGQYLSLLTESNQFHVLVHEITNFSAKSKATLKGYITLPPILSTSFEIDIYDILIITYIFWTIFCTVKFINYVIELFKEGFVKTLKRIAFRAAVKISPYVRKRIAQEMEKTQNSIRNELNAKSLPKTIKLPINGMNERTLAKRKAEWLGTESAIFETKKISGSLYIDNVEFEDKIKDFTSHILVLISEDFIYYNPLHYDLFTSTRQMEAEVISMTGNLISPNTHKEYYGVPTSGGTESIMAALLAYRNYGLKVRGIKKPNIVMSLSGHAAFDKGAFYFGIEVRKAKLNKDYTVNLASVKKLIDSNTICIMGSAPSFPHGTVDDFEGLSALALKYKCGLHVDSCLGSFVMPFAKEFGAKVGKYDFSLEGVTSISIDHHKYGLAPKGISVILYRTKELRKHQFFSCANWQGGIYGTPSFAGSKSGGPIAGAWYAMAYHGYEGYKENAYKILNATKLFKNKIQKIPEIELMGDCEVNVVAFTSRDPLLNIYGLASYLSTNGWFLTTLQNPPGIHLSLTSMVSKKIDVLISDIILGIKDIKENPEAYKKNKVAAIYGTANMVPDQNLIDESLFSVIDVFLEVAREK